MILSKRERMVAIIAMVIAIGLGLYYYLVGPLMERRAWAETQAADFYMKKVKPTQDQIRTNRENQKRLAEMTVAGLDLDFNNAKFVLLQAVSNWAREAGLSSFQQRSGDRPEMEKQFQKITLHVTTGGSMMSIGRFLWRVNTAAIPVRISDLQITPRREGTDDLQLQVSISTICFAPKLDKFGRPIAEATTKPVRLPARIDGQDSRSLFDKYSVLWDRNIFSYTRRVAGETSVREPQRGPRPTETYALRGTTELKDIESAKGPYAALIENGNTGTTDRYYVGDAIAGGRVTAIGYDYCDFEIAGQSRHIEVGKNLEGGSQIARADAFPTTMPSAGGTAAAGGAAASGAAPATGLTGGSVDDLAERMKARRAAELKKAE